MKKKNSRESYLSIRQKLIAAAAILLVAILMVASSSYAWFSLSTAPDVTGINTSVGANGSLEIALVPGTATVATITDDLANITAGVGDSGNNETWGNLVDLSDEKYGLQDITFYPSVLIVDAAGRVAHNGAILGIPVYGTDGRVKTVNADAVSGLYNLITGKFEKNPTAMGVTAIGNIFYMSQQQLDWMNAKSKTSTALSLAKTTAESTLRTNTEDLIDLIFSNVSATADTTYDMAAIGGLLKDLAGDANTPGIVDYIEEAMTYYIVACVATANPDMDDVPFTAMRNAIIADCTDGIFPVISNGKITISGVADDVDVSATMLDDVYAKYIDIRYAISESQNIYNTATSNGTATTGKAWSDVTAALSPLMDVNEVTINGHNKSEFTKENLSDFAVDIIYDGAFIIDMPKDSGVFADIGEICGNIYSTFRCGIPIPGGVIINDLPVNMKTSVEDGELKILANEFPPEPADRASVVANKKNLTSLYGYSLDFAFRTNAASSNLMLQTTETNRIYSSGGSAETQGHGSSMTFNVIDNKFTATDIQGLMDHIRIVFTDVNGTVLSAAKLDTENAEVTGTSVKAMIKMCESSVVSIDTDGVTGGVTVNTLSFGDFKEVNDNGQMKIMALSQNTPTVVSVYVYLDESVQSSSVAADAMKSAVGTMNLQFSSDENLVPMDYAEFKDASENTTSPPATTEAP